MQNLLQEVRYAFRQFRKSPGFTALAVVTLALGIGANTAMFTVVESLLLRPLPYANPQRLLTIRPPDEAQGSTSWLSYRDIRDQAHLLETTALYSEDVGVVQGKEGSQSVVTPGLTPNMFKLLGVKPLVGRTFTEDEGQTGGPQVVLLSEGLWREAFNADPQIAGHTIRVNGKPRTVVGVMPQSFRFPESMGAEDIGKGIWLPIQPSTEMQKDRGSHFFYVLASLKSDATLPQAQAELDAIAKRIREADPIKNRDVTFRAQGYQELLTGPVRPVFLMLVIGLGLVLLIACANVANLLIARCLGRQQEFAVRSALGAGQLRLVRQLFVEGGLLSLLGCGLGFGVALLIITASRKLLQQAVTRGDAVALHWPVVLALAAIATITTVLSSLIPALLVARTDPQPALQTASRGLGSRSVRARLSGWLVAGEVALSTLLLIATGLLFHTLWNLEHTHLGFETARVTSFTAMPADAAGFANMGIAQAGELIPTSVATLFYQPTLERLRQVPGVQDAALITALPLSGIRMTTSFKLAQDPDDPAHTMDARVTAVSGGYAQLMGTPILKGRMISNDDNANAPFVSVINQTLAHKYFSNRDPLGQKIDLGAENGAVQPYTVVGVIADQVDIGVSQAADPLLMLPYEQVPASSLYYQILIKTVVFFVVKTHGDIAVAPAVRSVFRQTAPDYAVDNFATMREVVDQSNFSHRLGLYLTAAFAGMAILMVVAGLYGVLAQLVSYRRREIGVRLALGSTRQRILGMFLRQGTILVVAGLGIGMVSALWAGRLVKSFLYQVQPLDGWTYASVVVLLLLVGALAALIPARRAAAVEPIEALRDE
jgi:putative ABC transport system permease protein